MTVYRQIVYQQGQDADETMQILDEHGKKAAFEHLLQWDNGQEDDVRSTTSAGSNDYSYKHGNYIMSYNLGLPYIGLEEVIHSSKRRRS
jgi:hypothetical protein